MSSFPANFTVQTAGIYICGHRTGSGGHAALFPALGMLDVGCELGVGEGVGCWGEGAAVAAQPVTNVQIKAIKIRLSMVKIFICNSMKFNQVGVLHCRKWNATCNQQQIAGFNHAGGSN